MDQQTKICSKCGQEKPFTSFAKDKARRDGLYPSCDTCRWATYGINRTDRRQKLSEDERRSKNSQYYQQNKEQIRSKQTARRAQNSDKYNNTSKRWYAEYGRAYYHHKYLTDIQHRLAAVLRARLRCALHSDQKAGSAVRDLGCSILELKLHLESKFLPGMTWGNYGKGVDRWNIDHIYPLISFDLSDPEQLKVACCYTNLQPLWEKDNLSKGCKSIPLEAI